MIFPKAPDKFESITRPSPTRVNPPISPPENVIRTIPEMPTRQPRIFLTVSLSDLKKIADNITEPKAATEVKREDFVPETLVSPIYSNKY